MLKKFAAFFVMAVLFSSFIITNAHAETSFKAEKFPYDQMQIQIMPEFDYPADWPQNTPSLLVGIYGTMTNKSGQDFDGKIEIPIPAKEKNFEVNLVAEFPDVNKSEVQRPYNVDKAKQTISWKPAKPIKNNETYRFVIEYYANSIAVKSKKTFTYQFTSQADIKTLDVIYYAPMNAKNITLTPKAQNTDKSDYGEELSYYEYNNVKAGKSFQFSSSYIKPGNESTLSIINKQQPPNDENHAGLKDNSTSSQTASTGTDSSRPIIGIGGAIIIGIAVIIAGLFVFFGLKRNNQPAKKRRSTLPKAGSKQPAKSTKRKENKLANDEAKKELRKKLLNGKIDQETYEEEMKKLI